MKTIEKPSVKLESIPLSSLHSLLIDAVRHEYLDPWDERPFEECKEWSAYRATITDATGRSEYFHIAYQTLCKHGAAASLDDAKPSIGAWFDANTPEGVLHQFLEMREQLFRQLGRRLN